MCDGVSKQQEIIRRVNAARGVMVSDEMSKDMDPKDIYTPDLDYDDKYKEPATLDVILIHKCVILIGFLVLLWLVGDM